MLHDHHRIEEEEEMKITHVIFSNNVGAPTVLQKFYRILIISVLGFIKGGALG